MHECYAIFEIMILGMLHTTSGREGNWWGPLHIVFIEKPVLRLILHPLTFVPWTGTRFGDQCSFASVVSSPATMSFNFGRGGDARGRGPYNQARARKSPYRPPY